MKTLGNTLFLLALILWCVIILWAANGCTSDGVIQEDAGIDAMENSEDPFVYILVGPLIGVDQWEGFTCIPPSQISIEYHFGVGILTRPDMVCIETRTETLWASTCHTLSCFNLFGSCLWFDDETFTAVNTITLEGAHNWIRNITGYAHCNQQFVVTAMEIY